jgi:hypothetical protein
MQLKDKHHQADVDQSTSAMKLAAEQQPTAPGPMQNQRAMGPTEPPGRHGQESR